MYTRNVYRLWNIFGILAVIVINALANLLSINGKTTGELSAKYPVLITPAGYAFSIWTLIYVLLIGFAIYQARRRAMDRTTVKSIGPWFLFSCVLNMAWIIVWHYEYVTSSVFVMLALLITLIVIYSRVQSATSAPTTGERILVQLPFSIYLGWISIATIVNVTVALYKLGWEGFGLSASAWTVILLALATLLALVIGGIYGDPFYVLVLVWAFIAIAVKQQENNTVAAAASIAAGLLAVYAIWIAIRKFRR
ncbi:TspO/MBR family protein [Paenibacillus mendelii]|uniref:TspO/MBR family protein n=1 Tax=Paenibacillus mendelii TaxID=206163 RepID=A0ABV6JJP3_9BACL|nr:TspO/MBR family protein [Paenibacillus mendelii]MCQ6559056.1 tryptophan-rich sensory protein [Paenibacillus mendelii]